MSRTDGSPRSRLNYASFNHAQLLSPESDKASSSEENSDDDYAYGYDSDGNPQPMRTLKIKKNRFSVLKKLRIRSFRKGKRFWVYTIFALFIIYEIFRLYVGSEYIVRPEDVELDRPNEFLRNKKQLVSGLNIKSSIDEPFQFGCGIPDTKAPRASAAFVMLARNSEIEDVIKSMKSLERHFNQWYNYSWVFLNEQPFTDDFKETVAKYTNSQVEFGFIEPEQWEFDKLIDRGEFYEFIESQGDRKIMYGNLESYHKMCRFYSGFFYKHELVKKRDWYWRVEPDVEFFCDLTYDPFIEMEKRNKKYGFNVLIDELYYTIPGLFKETRAYIRDKGIKVKDTWELFIDDSKHVKGKHEQDYDGIRGFKRILRRIESNIYIKRIIQTKKKSDQWLNKLSPQILEELFDRVTDRPGINLDRFDREEYNLCHFWSNFEIARTDLFNSKTYEEYFKHLEKSGGFYKERWGDAPIHSLGVAMLLSKEEIHYFRDIGYKHSTLGHCPNNSPSNQLKYEAQDPILGKDEFGIFSKRTPDKPIKNGVGCRCRCPLNMKEIENLGSSCIKNWAKFTGDNYRQRQPLDLDYWEKEMERKINKNLATGGNIGDNLVDDIVNNLE